MAKPLPRHFGFYIACGAGAVALGATALVAAHLAVIVGVNALFAAYLLVMSTQIRTLTADFLRHHADEEDTPGPYILGVTVIAIAASALSLFLAANAGGGPDPVQLSLAVLSVVLGWLAIHTMWATHYAYRFHRSSRTTKKAGTGGSGARQIAGGLEFPGGEAPDGTAFLYFAYVVGMTAQTSDVGVTTNAMRRMVTLQSLFAFFFNTILVAAAVNIVVSLGASG